MRKHRENAETGVPVGGRRPFGYLADKRSIDPVEAEVIREGARMLLAGAPLNSVVNMWNDKGCLTPAGGRWVRHAVKVVYRNPRISGFRSRGVKGLNGQPTGRVEVVRLADGSPVTVKDAAGNPVEPILSPETWEAVCAVVDANRATPRTNTEVPAFRDR